MTEVYEGSAAAKAGIEAGDVIYSLNGKKLMDTEDLFDELSTKQVGAVIRISVARGEQVLNLEATLTKYSDVITN